jgi:hypothetical protein
MAVKGELWMVRFDSDAVIDLEDVKSRGDRKAVFQAVAYLKELGPHLGSPHMKSLKGEADLFELRPKRGALAVRPIYARLGDQFLILAVAPTKPRFGRAVIDARARLSRHFDGR